MNTLMPPIASRPISGRSASKPSARLTNFTSADNSDSGLWSRLRANLKDMRFGEVTILVQDGQIVRIDIEDRRPVARPLD